jgi:hypothetical protein
MSETRELERPLAERPAPARRSRVLPVLAIAMAGVMVLVGLGVLAGIRGLVASIPTPGDIAAVFEPEPYEQIGPVVVTSLRNLADLTTVETVQYTLIEKGTDAGWLSWARGDTIRLFAVAKIGAGVDLSKVTVRDVTVDSSGVVEIDVPKPTIQYVAPDNEATQVLDRNMGLLTKGDPQLESETRVLADTVLLQNALDAGILYDAELNARRVITDFLLSLGYRDVIVRFVD